MVRTRQSTSRHTGGHRGASTAAEAAELHLAAWEQVRAFCSKAGIRVVRKFAWNDKTAGFSLRGTPK